MDADVEERVNRCEAQQQLPCTRGNGLSYRGAAGPILRKMFRLIMMHIASGLRHTWWNLLPQQQPSKGLRHLLQVIVYL